MTDISKRVAARRRRLAEFPGEGMPPRGKLASYFAKITSAPTPPLSAAESILGVTSVDSAAENGVFFF